MSLIPLAEAHEEGVYGGKAVNLGAALRAGLPVPGGVAVSTMVVDAIVAGNDTALSDLVNHAHLPGGQVAVRSSAIGEDSGQASFAGQHATRLNVTRTEIAGAVRDVWQSGRTDAARAYRARLGVTSEPAVAVVVQAMVDPLAAGVLFTRNPMTGADERVIEAAWGLGEVVVSSRIIPDYYRLASDGGLLEQVPGDKDVRIAYDERGGTIEIAVAEDLRREPCLTLDRLERLHALSERCREIWGPHLDLEFAFAADNTLFLLQSRPITAGGPAV